MTYQVTILSLADQYDENREQGLCTVVCIVHGGLYCARWFVLCTVVCIVHGGLYCAVFSCRNVLLCLSFDSINKSSGNNLLLRVSLSVNSR